MHRTESSAIMGIKRVIYINGEVKWEGCHWVGRPQTHNNWCEKKLECKRDDKWHQHGLEVVDCKAQARRGEDSKRCCPNPAINHDLIPHQRRWSEEARLREIWFGRRRLLIIFHVADISTFDTSRPFRSHACSSRVVACCWRICMWLRVACFLSDVPITLPAPWTHALHHACGQAVLW